MCVCVGREGGAGMWEMGGLRVRGGCGNVGKFFLLFTESFAEKKFVNG